MTIASWAGKTDVPGRTLAAPTGGVRRGLLLAALAAGALWAAHATDAPGTAEAVGRAGGDLTRLLRFMASIKATMATAVVSVVWWRLALPTRPGWLLAYLACGAAMAAGPVLIWDMARVGLGALLLHGGLFAAIVALWRDPAVAAALSAKVAARQRAGRAGRTFGPPEKPTRGAEAAGLAIDR